MRMLKTVRFFFRQRKVSRLNRTNRFVIPTVGRRLVVVPFRWLSLVPVVILVAASGYLLVRSDIFLVKNVEIQKVGGIPNDEEYAQGLLHPIEISEAIEHEIVARSVWNIDQEKIIKLIAELSPVVKSVDIEKKYPDTLIVVVTEHQPVAVLIPEVTEVKPDGSTITKKAYYLINEEGNIYQQIRRRVNLPEFFYPQIFSLVEGENIIGKTIDTEIIANAVAVTDALAPIEYFEVDSVEIVDRFTVRVQTNQRTTLFFALEENLAAQVRSLEIIYEQALFSGKELKQVDTRFDKIVVTYY